jgi:hypothetical protein
MTRFEERLLIAALLFVAIFFALRDAGTDLIDGARQLWTSK